VQLFLNQKVSDIWSTVEYKCFWVKGLFVCAVVVKINTLTFFKGEKMFFFNLKNVIKLRCFKKRNLRG